MPADETDLEVLQQIADAGRFPIQAFEFVQHGLSHTVMKTHGKKIIPGQNRHVTGRQLCEGLREYALRRWGLMARTVLQHWNITSTLDFGRIVFTLVEAGMLKTTDEDTLEDFREVFDFAAFEEGYRIESKV
jgi:uncharacterized repeat protein (TIGR04138 family)